MAAKRVQDLSNSGGRRPTAAISPIERQPRLSDRVADELTSFIRDSALEPGDALPSERELGERFGVSRTVIREATRALAERGVINVRTGAGLTVAQVSGTFLTPSITAFVRGRQVPYEKVHQVRTAIEVQIAGLAAEGATDAEIEELRVQHVLFCELARTDQTQTYAEADIEFHRMLAKMTHNELFLVMLDSISGVMRGVRRAASTPDGNESTVLGHAQILDCVARHDAAGARDAMVAHLKDAFRRWEAMGGPVDWFDWS